jgi:hypothetical protein
MSNECESPNDFTVFGRGTGSNPKIAKRDAVSEAMANGRKNCVFGKCGELNKKCGFTGLPGQAVVLNPDDDADGNGIYTVDVSITANCVCADK